MRVFIYLLKLIIIFSLNSFSIASYATVWPTFLPPNLNLLLDQQLIETKHCPAGQGKLLANTTINILQHLCKTFCPENWSYIGISDGNCHPLKTAFTFQKYDIEYDRNDNGEVISSTVTANFGLKGTSEPLIKFVFTTPNEHWYCYEANPNLHFITCANDV